MTARDERDSQREQFGSRWLRISRALPHNCSLSDIKDATSPNLEQALHEDDEEALDRSNSEIEPFLVNYDIVLSPTYQVPVLYVTFEDTRLGLRHLPSPVEVYDLLVPESYRPQIDGIGVMGALSLTDHPVLGCPAYFMHPCRTAEAMKQVSGGLNLEPEDYLLRWFGLIGQGVGLEIPIELAVAVCPEKEAASVG